MFVNFAFLNTDYQSIDTIKIFTSYLMFINLLLTTIDPLFRVFNIVLDVNVNQYAIFIRNCFISRQIFCSNVRL